MEFNFVDQGDGFYSIQTVNRRGRFVPERFECERLAWRRQEAGGPGKPDSVELQRRPTRTDNELFEIVMPEEDRVHIQVKSSGLCLEDPGRGGTIRQNLCNPSNPNQEFTLTE